MGLLTADFIVLLYRFSCNVFSVPVVYLPWKMAMEALLKSSRNAILIPLAMCNEISDQLATM